VVTLADIEAARAQIHDAVHAAIGETEVVLTIETSGREPIEAVAAAVRAAGYEVAEVSPS
jgi:hypothetical protein